MRFAPFLLLLFSLLSGAPRALAQDDARTEEARGAFLAGQAAYRAGRFAEALSYFERAYELTEEPDVLYNIATIHERLRHDREALDAYRRFLEARPGSDDRANIEARIAVLERAIGPDEGDDSTEDETSEETTEPPSTPAPSAGVDPAPWIVVAVGGALVVTGVGLLVATQIDIDTVAAGDRWVDIQAAYDRVPILSGIGFAALGLGVAALAGGLVWAVVGSGSSTEVAIGPGHASVRGRF